jgi:hypothetical protein
MNMAKLLAREAGQMDDRIETRDIGCLDVADVLLDGRHRFDLRNRAVAEQAIVQPDHLHSGRAQDRHQARAEIAKMSGDQDAQGAPLPLNAVAVARSPRVRSRAGLSRAGGPRSGSRP